LRERERVALLRKRNPFPPIKVAGTMDRDAEDYAMEQEMEIEALEAILMEDITKLTDSEKEDLRLDNDALQCYRVKVEADENAEAGSFPPVLGLIFAHTEKYPDELPFLRLESLASLTVSDVDRLTEILNAKMEECLGMSMIYELCTEAKDWMQNKMGMNEVIEDEAETKLRLALEEEERRARERAAGTPCTPESFAGKAAHRTYFALDRRATSTKKTKASPSSVPLFLR